MANTRKKRAPAGAVAVCNDARLARVAAMDLVQAFAQQNAAMAGAYESAMRAHAKIRAKMVADFAKAAVQA
ncbi:MAG TPA: hypothetical protein VNY05_37585 [Candidatus Acidoferrales bacterium]|jgi:hypothetical protein|nr:hypothetical protein [Candidatus Acidoferrales bacterium]